MLAFPNHARIFWQIFWAAASKINVPSSMEMTPCVCWSAFVAAVVVTEVFCCTVAAMLAGRWSKTWPGRPPTTEAPTVDADAGVTGTPRGRADDPWPLPPRKRDEGVDIPMLLPSQLLPPPKVMLGRLLGGASVPLLRRTWEAPPPRCLLFPLNRLYMMMVLLKENQLTARSGIKFWVVVHGSTNNGKRRRRCCVSSSFSNQCSQKDERLMKRQATVVDDGSDGCNETMDAKFKVDNDDAGVVLSLSLWWWEHEDKKWETTTLGKEGESGWRTWFEFLPKLARGKFKTRYRESWKKMGSTRRGIRIGHRGGEQNDNINQMGFFQSFSG
jgi:hypothetical protein